MRVLAIIVLASVIAHAEIPVRYVLADRVVLADSMPDRRFDPQLTAGPQFRARFEAAFPNHVIDLSPDRMISPDERIIVILARITAARTAHMIQAGTVHTFDTVVVGDVSALDPWTGTNLYSATRMVSGKIQLGQSVLVDEDARLRQGFCDAYSRWIEVSVQELQRQLSPFVLDSTTIKVPYQARKLPGGIWPNGSSRGVRVGATLAAPDGHFARVTQVTERFAVIEDIAEPSRLIQPGEHYTLTVVDKPAERPEKRVALTWVGLPPTIPKGEVALDTDALLGLFSDYISKSGGLRILPPDLLNRSVRGEIQRLKETVGRYSTLANNGALTLNLETMVQAARENPLLRVEVGVIERYHGQREGPNKSVEHYYRLTLAAAVYRRCGSEVSPQYPIQEVIQHSEELASVTRPGVRETAPADAWFTITRNAVIRLSEKIVKDLTAMNNESGDDTVWRKGVVGVNHVVEWGREEPVAGTPIEWARPAGDVYSANGESLGKYERRMIPSKGFLNAHVLPGEKLQVGDVLRYQTTADSRPIVAFALEPEAPTLEWTPEVHWQLRVAADTLSRALDMILLPVEQPTNVQAERTLVLNVQALRADANADGALFTGQWRLRLMGSSNGSESSALFKTGVQTDTRVSREPSRAALLPLDVSGWSMRYVADSLKKLAEASRAKGITAVLATQSEEIKDNKR